LPARIALARFLLLGNDIAGLERQIVELQRISPDNADVLQLEGVLSSLKKDHRAALHKMELAYASSPSTATLLTLARQQYSLGEVAAAKSLMLEWLETHQSDVSTRIALAGLYVSDNDPVKAMTEFLVVLETDSRNVVALNNLAWYLRASDPGRALSYAELAAEVDPGSAPVMDTLAMVLLANKKMDLAQRAIERAIALKPSDPTLHYHAAQIMAAAGDKQGAIAILSSLLQTDTVFPEKARATELLAELER
jgi:Tfp pilus assembly protein PilF